MLDTHTASEYYVAPPEPPPSRRPPITTIGPLGWIRQNLLSSPVNSVATLLTTAVVAWFLWEFLSWSVRSAQWAVVFNNLRLIASGLYDQKEIWRVEATAAILVFLAGLGFGIWGYIGRRAFSVVAVVLAVVVVVPLIGARFPEPRLYLLIEPQRTPNTLIFIGHQNQEVTFGVRALTSLQDASQPLAGYVESQSRTDWSTQARAALDGQLDLSNYTLKLSVRLTDRSGNLISSASGPAEIMSSPDHPEATATASLPNDGWYMLQVERDDSAKADNAGYAWLTVDGVELVPSQMDVVQRREEEYGPPPTPDHGLQAEQIAFRFEGTQSFGEFVSLQIAPFLHNISRDLIAGTVLFFNGWVIGTLGKRQRAVRRATVSGWILAGPVILILLSGVAGSRSLPSVSTRVWGGLLLTILLTVIGITASFPLGVALALGRRSDLPAVKWTSTLFIETVRGVPLVTILFMAKLIIPFFSSALVNIDLTVRMMIGITLFSAAYLAENVRGGLQIIPHGQVEAARALGMNPILTMTFIILPQALRAVIPAIVGQFISLFKDTSLVAVVGLFELVGIVDTIVKGQPVYRPYQREAYIFVAIIYFVISYAMSDVSRRLEASGAGSVRRM
jgi:His/Glu/Gln/Arg/opine family amino acid ABC transporter permease subunit